MKREILVVNTATLFEKRLFSWFSSAEEFDYEKIILDHFEYRVRGDMEIDPSFQQPIPYALIWNPTTQKMIAYKRWSDESTSWEERLFWKWSLWVWGHIELDVKDTKNPMYETVFQEIEEEIFLKKDELKTVEVLWYINDNSDEVWKVHVWVLYLVTTDVDTVSINDGELEKVYFLSLDDIRQIINSEDAEMESWSRIAFEAFERISQAG